MKKRNFIVRWHVIGIFIVAIWIVLIGLLIKKVHFPIAYSDKVSAVKSGNLEKFRREWKEIFLKERKVGYSVNHIRTVDEGYIIQEEIFLKMDLMGLATGINTNTTCVVDKDFRLRTFRFKMSSGAVEFWISGSVEGDAIVVKTKGDERGGRKKIPIKEIPVMGIGLPHFFVGRSLDLGDVFVFPIFDPSTMSQRKMEMRVAAVENLTIKGISYKAYRVETELWGRTMTFWLDEEGATLKESGFMGLTAIRSSAAAAPENIQGSGDLDFYEMASIQPDRRIPKARELGFLKVELLGIEESRIDRSSWNNHRQKYDGTSMEIRRERPPFVSACSGAYEDKKGLFREYLSPEFNIESDHEEIVVAAGEIASHKRDPLSVARNVLLWTYENLEKRPVVSIPSAIEVLRTRVGDCNEHATLTTALLRASGVPARIAVGLVYMRGQFFYHAWTEAYIGKWISLDATMNQMPVDATHIKLIEGNLDKQVDIAGLMGVLELRVVDYSHDSSDKSHKDLSRFQGSR